MKNKMLRVLLSLVIAFGLWLFVVTAVSPGSEKTVEDIPVQVQGGTVDTNSGLIVFKDAGLIITNRIDQKVTLELYGNRVDLNKLNSTNIPIYLDVSKINEVGPNQQLGYEVDLSSVVDNSAVTVQKRTPGTISVNVEKWLQKEVDVLEPEITIAEGYHLESMEYDETIMLSGPARIVNKVVYAKIAPLADQKTKVDKSFTYELYDKDGKVLTADEMALLSDTQASFQKVHVKASVVMQRTITINPQLNPGGGLTESDVTITCTPSEIMVYGTEDVLDGLEESIRKWDIDLAKVTDGYVGTFTSLFLKEVGFVNEEETVDEIQYEIHYNDNIAEKNLYITDFVVEGAVPSDKEAVVLNQSLKITLRGPKNLIRGIAANNVTAVVNYDPSGTGEVTIHISESYAGVGVLDTGKHTVPITLRDKARSAA